MKRAFFAIAGTVVGLVALLDFKSHRPPVGSVAVGATPEAPQPATTRPKATPSSPHGATTAPAKTSSRSSSRTATAVPGGRFVGSAVQTQYGVVQVAVAISDGRITKVSFVQLTAFDPRSQEINAQAAPILVQETMSAQSAQIDSVSGATYTSAGYVQSLQSALDRAGLK